MRRLISVVMAVLMVVSLASVSFNAATNDAVASGAGAATVTFVGLRGEEVTKTYAVGETFTTYLYLNVSEATEGTTYGISSADCEQIYDPTILSFAEEYVTDEEDMDYGYINDTETIFPVFKDATIANAGEAGHVYYNASKASMAGFKFETDTSALMVARYTVIASGKVTISNIVNTLALSNRNLDRLVEKGEIVDGRFVSPVALSEPQTPVVTGYTVSGNYTSYIEDIDTPVTFELMQDDEVKYTATAQPAEGEYTIDAVAEGTYTLRVSKLNHVYRDYTVTVKDDVMLDVEINPIGDVNLDGDVTMRDYAKAYKYVQEIDEITDPYAFRCGDVNGNDGEITMKDYRDIYKHVQELGSLWVL